MTAGRGRTVLTLIQHYLPGQKSGGPLRSIANAIEHLGQEFNFLVVASDRDIGDKHAYKGVSTRQWLPIDAARIWYLAQSNRFAFDLLGLIRKTPHDVLYLNSFFCAKFSIFVMFALKVGYLKAPLVVIAPRGELAPGALKFKAFRKRAYLNVARVLRLYSKVTWQASSQLEADEIVLTLGIDRHQIIIAPDLPTKSHLVTASTSKGRGKISGELKLIFLSRVTRKKNLLQAIQCLKHTIGAVNFDIFGPIEDQAYWRECQAEIAKLPVDKKVTYKGPVEAKDVHATLAVYDIFFLPTFGENFCHAIAEALIAGCPVLISDRTPWVQLAQRCVGWDLPLDDMAAFVQRLQWCIDAPAEVLDGFRNHARQYGDEILNNSAAIEANRRLFLGQ